MEAELTKMFDRYAYDLMIKNPKQMAGDPLRLFRCLLKKDLLSLKGFSFSRFSQCLEEEGFIQTSPSSPGELQGPVVPGGGNTNRAFPHQPGKMLR